MGGRATVPGGFAPLAPLARPLPLVAGPDGRAALASRSRPAACAASPSNAVAQTARHRRGRIGERSEPPSASAAKRSECTPGCGDEREEREAERRFFRSARARAMRASAPAGSAVASANAAHVNARAGPRRGPGRQSLPGGEGPGGGPLSSELPAHAQALNSRNERSWRSASQPRARAPSAVNPSPRKGSLCTSSGSTRGRRPHALPRRRAQHSARRALRRAPRRARRRPRARPRRRRSRAPAGS